MTTDGLSPLGALVRRHDPDRFLTTLFAPAERREALWTLYAFNHELARAREVTREPFMTLIRLQWWREVVEGAEKHHEVATPLSALLRHGLLAREDLLAMIAGREAEAGEELATLSDFRGYIEATAGMLAVAAGRVLGADSTTLPRLQALGSAYGVAGVLRAVGVHARQGRVLLPVDALATRGLTPHDITAEQGADALRAVQHDIAGEGQALLRAGRGRIARPAIAAGLVGVLARRDLARPGNTAPRRLGDRLALIAAAMMGRV